MTVANNYNGATTISNGALQADSGVGIPSASLVVLDGGVYQSNSTYTFTRGPGHRRQRRSMDGQRRRIRR